MIKRITVLLALLLSMTTVTSCSSQGVTSVDEGKENATESVAESVEDSTFEVDITMEGGSGKAHIESPVTVSMHDGKMSAVLVWNSKNYDYMVVDGVKYDNENPEGNSTFTIPVETLDEPLKVIGDTVAMSKPHEIEYTIYWDSETAEEDQAGTYAISDDVGTGSVDMGALTQTGSLELKYATQFSVKEYGEYKLISIRGSGDYLLVPEGKEVPEGISSDITVLKQPLDKTYIASTSVMDHIARCKRLNHVRLAGLQADDWCVEEASTAMRDGKILYAGKYRAPDYELLLKEGCNLVIENTMIYHEPSVLEKLKELGMPVIVEMSSYEKHPLGRLEWIRLYGILYGAEDEANAFCDEQFALASTVMGQADKGVRVAFFHMTSTGLINVRKPGDYISEMIELAGGEYIIKDESIEEDNSLSTMNMQMEDFYVSAMDADIIIYNSTIAGEIGSVDELISMNGLFEDFKAVKNGQVYCTEKDLFQKTTDTVEFMRELGEIFAGDQGDHTYIKKLK